MQSKDKNTRSPGNYDGLLKISLVLFAVYSIIHATSNVGVSSIMGWIALVSILLLLYSNSVSRFSKGRERLFKKLTSFVGQVLIGLVIAVQITVAAGVWDAR